MGNRIPKMNDNCIQNYDGRKCMCLVTGVNHSDKLFDVITSFNEPMLNIPFDKFQYDTTIGEKTIQMLIDKYSLSIFFIDGVDMAKDIDSIIEAHPFHKLNHIASQTKP